jgi:integrase/recombinase XerD
MTPHHPENEAMKREYLLWLENARGQDIATTDQVASALARYESHTGWQDFRSFSPDQAIGFKAGLWKATNAKGKPLAKATVCALLRQIQAFFEWLSHQPTYRRAVLFSDAAYLRPTDNDARVASARREKPYPTVEQIHAAIASMPGDTAIQRRDRAVIALILLTGGRDGAVASLQIKHLDVGAKTVFFDAREVKTKGAKTFKTRFYPVSGEAEDICIAWEKELREVHLFWPEDPLFPSTAMAPDANGVFASTGLARTTWASANPIRAIFRAAFAGAGLPYFNPHSVRKTLVSLMYSLKLSQREQKAWSQNMGHEHVQTTLQSYGRLREEEQIEAIAEIGSHAAQGNDATPITLAQMEELMARHAGNRAA